MDARLDCEVRLAEHYRTVAEVDAEGWTHPRSVARYRVTLAQVLVTLAARIAPTVTVPSTTPRALAR
jgi:hypothetical protein